MTLVGYARVSTREQNPASQVAELEAAGCKRVFVDHGESSRIAQRPEWVACLDYLRPGDVLVFRALDRIAGSERMAIDTLMQLRDRGVEVRSLTEAAIDTTTAAGTFVYSIMAALAQLRVDTIRENTMRGLAHARAQGRVGGRPTVMTPEKVAAARRLREATPPQSYAQIARVLGVGATSVRRALEVDEAASDRGQTQRV